MVDELIKILLGGNDVFFHYSRQIDAVQIFVSKDEVMEDTYITMKKFLETDMDTELADNLRCSERIVNSDLERLKEDNTIPHNTLKVECTYYEVEEEDEDNE